MAAPSTPVRSPGLPIPFHSLPSLPLPYRTVPCSHRPSDILTRRAHTDHADLAVHLIDAPDYLASSLCHFTTPQPVELSTTIADDNVTQQVVLDPPQPVLSVRCEGMCVGTYGESATAFGDGGNRR